MIINKYSKTALLLLALSLFSCKSSIGPNSVNKNFEEKFSKQVELLKAEQKKSQKYLSGENYTPDAQTRQQGLSNFAPNQIPPDIFEIRYNLHQHPPFRVSGLKFDNITIPQQGASGVSSDFNDKQYIMAGNDALQRSIDHYDSSLTQEDLEFSEILISEQKELLRQKRAREIFGRQPTAKQKEQKKEKDWARAKREKRNDPVRRTIAAQVAAYNVYKNRPTPNNNQQNNPQ